MWLKRFLRTSPAISGPDLMHHSRTV